MTIIKLNHGADNERANDLQKMLNDKSIKAIFCVRGGYGTVKDVNNLILEAWKLGVKTLGIVLIPVMNLHYPC